MCVHSCRVLDAPVPGTPSNVLKLRVVDHSSCLPTAFRGKSSQVALEDVRNIYTQEILSLHPHCLDEGLH